MQGGNPILLFSTTYFPPFYLNSRTVRDLLVFNLHTCVYMIGLRVAEVAGVIYRVSPIVS